MSVKQVVTRRGGTPKITYDAALNDSDKSFTVPVGKQWHLTYLWARIVATATVGNRYLVAIMTDGTNEIWRSGAGSNVAASNSGSFLMRIGITQVSSTVFGSNVANVDGLPDIVMKAGYVLRIYDGGAIDAAADDLTVVLAYDEYEA